MVTAAFLAPIRAMEGDVLAASDFRSKDAWTLQGSGWSKEGIQVTASLPAKYWEPHSDHTACLCVE